MGSRVLTQVKASVVCVQLGGVLILFQVALAFEQDNEGVIHACVRVCVCEDGGGRVNANLLSTRNEIF